MARENKRSKDTAEIYDRVSQMRCEISDLEEESRKRLEEAKKKYSSLRLQVEECKNRILELRELLRDFDLPFGRAGYKKISSALVLDFIEAGVSTLSELCEATGYKNTSVSQCLQLLEKKREIKRVLEAGKMRGAKYLLTDEKLQYLAGNDKAVSPD